MRFQLLPVALLLVGTLSSVVAPPAHAESLTPEQTARTLAGLDVDAMSGDAARKKLLKSFAKNATEKWGKYWKQIGQPMTDWARTEVPHIKGETVFYPFSGPDFPTAMQLFPDAGRYVLVALQNAGPMPNLRGMEDKKFNAYMNVFKRGWVDFARRGFFRTDDLKADTKEGEGVLSGVTPVLMAFAARLGFSVTDVLPLCIKADGSDLETHPGDRAKFETWKSVRFELKRQDGSRTVLDYVQLDISDASLKKQDNARTWLATVAKSKTMTKAASHLMQKPFFAVIRDIVVGNSPVLVQDETGVDYKYLQEDFKVMLYGRFEKAHKLFVGGLQRELVAAYKKRDDVKPLPFRFGYEKDKGSAVMIAVRN